MSIPLVLGFERGMASPLDADYIQADITARNAIDPNIRYPGMTCYVDADNTLYILTGGIANTDWQPVGSGSSTGYQQTDFDASDFYDVSGTDAYYDDTLGAVFPQGVDSSLMVKMATPYRWGLANLLSQISWQHGAISGGGYTSYFGVPGYWSDTAIPSWNVDKYSIVESNDFFVTASGTWNTGLRPSIVRVTVDLITVNYGRVSLYANETFQGIRDGLTPGVQQFDIDVSSPGDVDIDSISVLFNIPPGSTAPFNTWDVTNIEFFTPGGGTDVEFDVSARVLDNGNADTQAFGTAVTISDTGGTDGTRYITPRSTNVTPGGTPAKGCDIEVKITRTGTTDTLSADAYLQNLRLFFDADQSNDEAA